MPDDGPRTLRDEFAMAALIGLIASNRLAGDGKSDARCECDLEANIAFEYADSMVVHRSKFPDPDSPLWEPESKET